MDMEQYSIEPVEATAVKLVTDRWYGTRQALVVDDYGDLVESPRVISATLYMLGQDH